MGDAFAIVPERVIDADVSDRAVRLYALLDRYAGADGHAYPSRATLARRLRCSPDTVDRAVRELEAAGLVDVERRRLEDGRGLTSNRYHLAARSRLPSRTGAASSQQGRGHPGRNGAGSPSRTGAAEKESHSEREMVNETASSSRVETSTAAAELVDDDGVLNAAMVLLAERDLERARADKARRGERHRVGDRAAWVREAAARRVETSGVLARAYLEANPDLEAEGLADLVDEWRIDEVPA